MRARARGAAHMVRVIHIYIYPENRTHADTMRSSTSLLCVVCSSFIHRRRHLAPLCVSSEKLCSLSLQRVWKVGGCAVNVPIHKRFPACLPGIFQFEGYIVLLIPPSVPQHVPPVKKDMTQNTSCLPEKYFRSRNK